MELVQVPFVMLIAALIFLPAVGLWRSVDAERARRRLMESTLRTLSRDVREIETELFELRQAIKQAGRELREIRERERGFRGPGETVKDPRPRSSAPGDVLADPLNRSPRYGFVPTAPPIPAAAPVNPRFKYVKGE